jgi:hypothetical protein
MKILKYLPIILIFLSLESKGQFVTPQNDWLIKPIQQKSTIIQKGSNIILDNGLLRREFYLGKNLACYSYVNVSNGQQLLRAVQPEAKIVLNGKMYAVGGMEGQKERAYLKPEWLSQMTAGKEDFVFVGSTISDVKPFISWQRKTWASNHEQATGKQISFEFTSPLPELKGIHVYVNYEMIDGLPLLIKWVQIENKSLVKIGVDRVIHEVLGLVEEESAVVGKPEEMKKQHGIYVETNYAFNNAMRYDISDQTTHWKTELTYTSQVNYNFETPCLLEIYPEKAPGIDLKPGEIFKSAIFYK